jgi:hypothetical protein
MTQIKSSFSVSDFENYGATNPFLSADQQDQVAQTENRVNLQLDWLAQLLGWSGDNYWNNLASNVNQKRQLQTGSFGFFNGFLYPEIVSIKNWENTVTIKADSRILPGLTFYLGDYSYQPVDLRQSGNEYIVTFDSLPDQFYTDIADNKQLKVISPQSHPSPFARPQPGTSGDASFLCDQQGETLVLFPSYDNQKTLPYLYNVFIVGCRYYFDKPVYLIVSSTLTVYPEYDFTSESWYLEIPLNSATSEVGLTATLSYEESLLEVSLVPWVDPSDWGTKDKIENFTGVWGNKGGNLPFSFTFDALGIHGFDEAKSVSLKPVERTVAFDDLLNFIYYQRVDLTPGPPSSTKPGQVWWDTQNGDFSVHLGDPLNCGPWVEVVYPHDVSTNPVPDYVFPDVESFTSYTGSIPEGCLVRILDLTGLGPSEYITGVYETFAGPGEIDMFKEEDSPYWTVFQISYKDETIFSDNAEATPAMVRVNLIDSNDLSPEGATYLIQNLQFSVDGSYPLLLMRSSGGTKWYIAPPSNLKYIGNTRLFSSSLDYDHPTEGEMSWDFSVTDSSLRAARTFYYSRWVFNSLDDKWVLEGDWVNVNSLCSSSAVPEVVNFGAVKVYCDGELMQPGSSSRTENYQFEYTVDAGTGNFNFLYTPITFVGSVNLPRVTISDSITSVFTQDISNLVFSGLSYYMSPNVLDSETLLRVWKSKNLHVVDSLSDLELLRNSNPLRADINTGPGDNNWERYFLRLPPAYQRNGSAWQKVNLVCQDFGYWGSSILPESMECPPEETKPRIYEAVHLYGEQPDSPIYLYSEPYLYSDVVFGFGYYDDFDNSAVLPGYEIPFDDFYEAEIIKYEPLHNRQADVVSEVGRGYGEWEGAYYRATPCADLTGFLVNDMLSETLEPLAPPVWDSSIYKLPPTCINNRASSTVDANHYKVGYAFFSADLSAAEDGCFDFVAAN